MKFRLYIDIDFYFMYEFGPNQPTNLKMAATYNIGNNNVIGC